MNYKIKASLLLILYLALTNSDKLLSYITAFYPRKSKKRIENVTDSTKDDYAKVIETAANMMTQLLLEKWDFQIEKSGVKIYLKPGSDKIHTFRGDGTFDRNYTVQEIISVIKSPVARKDWDGRYAQGRILEIYRNSFITLSTQKGTFPFAAREFSTIGKLELLDNHARLISTSITHPKITYDTSKVLGHLYLGGWDIKKNEKSLFISYIVQVDVGGSIPSALLKTIQTQSPLCVAAVIDYLDKSGPLPFIISNTLSGIQVLAEEYYASTGIYQITVKNESSNENSLTISMPCKRFKGAKIQISGHQSCQIVKRTSKYSKWISSPDDIVLLMTFLSEVRVEITPVSKGFTINGAIASQVVKKFKLTKLKPSNSPEIVSLVSPSLKSAEKILVKVDESWESAVDKVADSINYSHSFARRNTSRLVNLAKMIFFN